MLLLGVALTQGASVDHEHVLQVVTALKQAKNLTKPTDIYKSLAKNVGVYNVAMAARICRAEATVGDLEPFTQLFDSFLADNTFCNHLGGRIKVQALRQVAVGTATKVAKLMVAYKEVRDSKANSDAGKLRAALLRAVSIIDDPPQIDSPMSEEKALQDMVLYFEEQMRVHAPVWSDAATEVMSVAAVQCIEEANGLNALGMCKEEQEVLGASAASAGTPRPPKSWRDGFSGVADEGVYDEQEVLAWAKKEFFTDDLDTKALGKMLRDGVTVPLVQNTARRHLFSPLPPPS